MGGRVGKAGLADKEIRLRVNEVLHARCVEAAESASLPLTSWVIMAMNAYLSKWQSPLARAETARQDEANAWPSGWPKDKPCPVCHNVHRTGDPKAQHNMDDVTWRAFATELVIPPELEAQWAASQAVPTGQAGD